MAEERTTEAPTRARRTVEYVIEASNVHHLATSLQAYAREKHYELILDASVFCSFDRLLAQGPLEGLKRHQLFNLRLFYAELLRFFEAYGNIVLLPEVKAEFANLVAAGLAQIDRKKLQYNALSPAKKDQVVEHFNALLRIEELLRKLRAKIEDRAKALPRTHEGIFDAFLDIVTTTAEVLQLKKPDAATRSVTDERLAARAFHEVIVHHKRVAVTTRDEDVRRIVSTVYKLLVSSTLRDESARIVLRALQLSNIVVLKWHTERDEYTRFFESQTQPEIGEFIFSKFLPEKSRQRLVQHVRAKLQEIARHMEALSGGEDREPLAAARESTALVDALAHVWDRTLWYQEVARAVGVADAYEEMRVQRSLRDLAKGLHQEKLADAIEKSLDQLARRRIHSHLRELEDRNEELNRELLDVTAQQRHRQDIATAERLRTIASEIAEVMREKHFFELALSIGEVHLTSESFRRAEELCERFAANGFDLRSGPVFMPPTEIADLTGRDYASVLRIVSERDLVQENGLVRMDLSTLMRTLL